MFDGSLRRYQVGLSSDVERDCFRQCLVEMNGFEGGEVGEQDIKVCEKGESLELMPPLAAAWEGNRNLHPPCS